MRRLIPYRDDRVIGTRGGSSPRPGASGWWAFRSSRRERLGGGPRLDCCLCLERVEDVEGALGDLAGDGQRGGVRAGVTALAAVELVVGAVLAAGVLGGLDQRPAQRRRPLLGELTASLLAGGIF